MNKKNHKYLISVLSNSAVIISAVLLGYSLAIRQITAVILMFLVLILSSIVNDIIEQAYIRSIVKDQRNKK